MNAQSSEPNPDATQLTRLADLLAEDGQSAPTTGRDAGDASQLSEAQQLVSALRDDARDLQTKLDRLATLLPS